MITKAAKTVTEQEDPRSKAERYLGLGSTGAGTLLAMNALDSGDLTGRETLYHGTDPDAANSIRRRGLMPTTESNVVNTDAIKGDRERYAKALGKAYTTRNKTEARSYAVQTMAKRKAAKGEAVKALDMMLNLGDGVVKLNVPVWKMKTVMNPEVDMPFEEWRKRLGFFANLYDEGSLKRMYKDLRRAVVFDGGVGAEYVKGAKGYRGLTPAELVEYIRANPRRFARGLGKAGLGAGLAGGGAYLLGRQYLEDDAS